MLNTTKIKIDAMLSWFRDPVVIAENKCPDAPNLNWLNMKAA